MKSQPPGSRKAYLATFFATRCLGMHEQVGTRAGNNQRHTQQTPAGVTPGVAAMTCSPPQALGPVGVVCVRTCGLTSLPLNHQAYTRCSGLARPCAPALPCLDVFLGAEEFPFGDCLWLVPLWHRVQSVV